MTRRVVRWAVMTVLLAWGLCGRPVGLAAGQSTQAGTQPTTASLPAGPQATSDYEGRRITAREGTDAGSSVVQWLQPLAALAAVVAMIFILRLVLARLGRRGGVVGRGSAVQVVARSDLSPRCQLFLLRLGRRLLLVGLGPDGPVTLSELSDPSEVADLLAAVGKAPPSGGQAPPDGGAVGEVSQKIRSRLESLQKDQS